jgi:hypothetical protein
MKTPHEMIIVMFQRSAFALTFETDEVLGYRSGPQGEVLRALSINLKQRTVEYELRQTGLPTERRVEHSANLAHLVEKLPLTADSFDLKFKGLKLTEEGAAIVQARDRVSLAGTQDPWDLTNYYEKSRAGKPQGESGLKLVDEKFK